MEVATLVLVIAVAAARFVVVWRASRTIERADGRDTSYPQGRRAAALIIERQQLDPVVVRTGDVDAYLAREQTLQLVARRFRGQSLAAVVIVAHEAAHAAQHRDGAAAWRWWWTLGMPAVFAGIVVAPAALLAALAGLGWLALLALACLVVMAAAGVASAFTERGATRWALAALREQQLVDAVQLPAARRVLRAAAARYVADSVWDVGYIERRLIPGRGPQAEKSVGGKFEGSDEGWANDFGSSGSGDGGGGGCGGGGGA